MSLHDDWKESPVGQAKFVTPKIGESVKTKRVEIDAMFVKFLPERDCLMFQHKVDDAELAKLLTPLREVKITFEIPIPERKVEITESDIERIMLKWADDESNRSFDTFIKDELFRGVE